MNYLPEIREILFHNALQDLNIIRWTLLEEQMKGERATDYLEALLLYRDAEDAYEVATKTYKAFLKTGTNDWDEEERLYEVVRKHRIETDKTHQFLQDMLLESAEYKEELPYGK